MINNREELQKIREYDVDECSFDCLYDHIDNLANALEAAWEERDGYKGQLELIKKQAWKRVELIDGEYVTFVGVHALAWEQHWGLPEVAFNRWDDMPKREGIIGDVEEQMRNKADTEIEEHIEELERLLPGGQDGSSDT